MKTTNDNRRTLLFVASVAINLSLLFYFKYAHFFAASFIGVLPPAVESFLHVALPAGISFYTFQSISYMADIYQERAAPKKNFWEYAAFISFFPHLLAGPITRHNQLLPQLEKLAATGARLCWEEGILLFSIGLIKKVVIADSIARIIDPMIATAGSLGMLQAWLTIFGYAIQLYFDFSAYSDMAIGLGRLIGIELPQNFDSPFRSLNPSEFWTRWHITFSRWIQDYLFEPMSYSFLRRGWPFTLSIVTSVILTLALAGLWHGANWTFVVFGLYQAFIILLYHGTKNHWNTLPVIVQRTGTFLLLCGSWVFFRADSLTAAMAWFAAIAGHNGTGINTITQTEILLGITLLVSYGACILLPNASSFDKLRTLPVWTKAAVGSFTAIALMLFSLSSRFLYFNF